MGRGDVAHIEGRILAQPDHIHIRKVALNFLTKVNMFALHALQRYRPCLRHDAAFAIGQRIGCIYPNIMAARLRFLSQTETAVRFNVHGFDGVHLKGDFHTYSPDMLAPASGAPGENAMQIGCADYTKAFSITSI